MLNRNIVAIFAAAGSTVLLGGCPGPAPDTGVYVRCKPNNNYHWGWSNSSCVDSDGNTVTKCPIEKPHDRTYCYEKDEWLISGGDTGEAEDTEGIDRHNWPTHGPSDTYIRNRCSELCEAANLTNTPACAQADWQVQNLPGQMGTQIQNPGELNCKPWYSKNRVGRDASTTDVIPAGTTPRWRSDAAFITLPCGDYLACADDFKQNLFRLLATADSAVLPSSNDSEADYLARSSNSSSSLLALTIDNGGSPSSDSDWVAGRIEYTALDCGLATCPFYLGNLVLTNASDTWDLWSADWNDNVDVTDIDARLRRPMLGVWRPATGEIYLPAQMLDLQVKADVKIGSWTAVPITRIATNASDVFGHLSSTGAVELSGLVVTDGQLTASADVEWDVVDGRPPVASISVASTVSIPSGHSGYPITSITNNSSDPDGDLGDTVWFVDGEQFGEAYEIPVGSHTVRIGVFDRRLAFDTAEVSITVTP
jgi:hypothetical protein